ncbi:MAG: ATP-binding cassette domain-containing protein, partial [Gilliamella sp.]|nr:ATP-binding cassette domain-containing protein [Gilliamella sp.]
MSYLELTNVTKKINDETVLNDINLKIDQGKIIGFVGTNGSGKTMLFRAILGLIKISSGQVILKGQEVGLKTELQVNVGDIIE